MASAARIADRTRFVFVLALVLGLIAAACTTEETTRSRSPSTVPATGDADRDTAGDAETETERQAESGVRVIELERTVIELPMDGLDDDTTIAVREIEASNPDELRDGFIPAGRGVEVNIDGELRLPAVVTFDVSPPPSPEATPIAMHVADDGSSRFVDAQYSEGRLSISTTEFSSWFPGWLNPVEWVRGALGGLSRLVGLRTDPPLCAQPAPWALYNGTDSAAVHACMSANGDGIPELVIRSNRAYWLQINVPEPNQWVWVSNIASWAHGYALGGSGRYLLPPGETMTIGMQQPTGTARDFTVTLERNNRTLALSAFSMWFGEAGYLGELYTLGRCGYDSYFTAGGFVPDLPQVFACLTDGFAELSDPTKAFTSAEAVLGQAAVSDADVGERLSRLAGRFEGLGGVLKTLGAGFNAVTGVDSLTDELAEPWAGATVSARLLPAAPPATAAPAPTAPATTAAPALTAAPTSPTAPPTAPPPPTSPSETSPPMTSPPTSSQPSILPQPAPRLTNWQVGVRDTQVTMSANLAWEPGSDPITCEFLVDGYRVFRDQCGNPASYTATYARGSHNFQLVACNRSGSCSSSEQTRRDVGAPSAPPPGGLPQTTGGVANTWTNYTNAGGQAGPRIARNQTVLVSCRLNGFQVANGNTWWYRIASEPWSNNFYVSADVFYNNGRTSGSLAGTPYVDERVPLC